MTGEASYRWSLRARGTGQTVTVHTGKAALVVGRQVVFEPADPPSALDTFVAALAADLVQGFLRAARERRIAVDDAELSLNWELENPLVHFGVIGEEGSPRLSHVDGTLYVSGDFDEETAGRLWQEALERSPIVATLEPVVGMQLKFQIV